MSWMTWSFQWTRTFWALMVMPRSRSMSMESRNCSRMSRGSTAPHSSRMRSVRVVLPWSMWLSVLTQRIRVVEGTTGQGTVGLLMANIKSQIKRNRQNERRRLRNKAARSEIKTRVKRAAFAPEPARWGEGLAGRECRAADDGRRLRLVDDARPRQPQDAGVVALQDRHHLERMAGAVAQHALELAQGEADVATIDRVGEVP